MTDDATRLDRLVDLVTDQRNLLVAVATGGPQIDSVNAQYKKRRREIRDLLLRFHLDDPIRWTDLWEWYAHWSSELPTYAARRTYINDILSPLLERVERLQSGSQLEDWAEGEGGESESWEHLEGRLIGLRAEFQRASEQDDFQDVGRRSREILIEVASLVFSEEMVEAGEEVPGRNDSKARIDAFLKHAAAGSHYERLRKLLRAAYDLMQHVTHSKGITREEAFAAGQAAFLLVRTLRLMSGEDGQEEEDDFAF
jgi:hypothetical protein